LSVRKGEREEVPCEAQPVAPSEVILQKALLKSGTLAEATILDVRDTGVTVNNIYAMIQVRPEVRPPGGKPYQAATKMLISRFHIPQFQPGAVVVSVKYDPKDRFRISLDHS
jgi:hypothetical protein